MVTQSIPLVADLRTQNRNIGTIYLATGLVTEGDTGGGIYFWNPSSTNADDGFYYLQVTGVATGRWVRIYAGSNIYNTDGSLLDNRDLTLNSYYLKFIGSSANSTFNADGSVTLSSLSGINTRMVVANNAGTLATQSFVPGTTIRFVEKFTATLGQTVFNTTNTLYSDLFDVFLNGVKLNTDSFSFTANQITLFDGAYADDVVDVVGFSSATVYASLPSQAGNAGKYLFTNGTNLSWEFVYGLPIGGTTGQVLKKFSNSNYDVYWAIDAGGLTSVGLSMPSAFNVANSPLTSDGTIAVTGAGTAAQYVRGDGQLATFPSTASGGSSVNYYLNGSVNASVGGYKQLANTATIGGGTDFTLVGNGLIAQFLTDVGNPNRVEIPGGAWNFEMYFQVSSSGGNQKFYVELLKYDGVTFTSIASGITVPEEITGGTSIDLYLTSLAVPTTALLVTDRLAIRVYIVDNAGGRTVTLHTEDNTLCEIITTFSGGIAALNGLSANTQYLATGTSGTDFNISSLTDTHTFNLPTASATNRGALSSADWSTFNAKVPSTRTLTINGTAYDLSADRSWTVSAANIYTADGTLTGNRTVDLSTYTLNFSNRINLSTSPSGSNDFPTIEIGSTSAIGGRNQYGALKLSRSAAPSSSVQINPYSANNLYIGNTYDVLLGSVGVRIGNDASLGYNNTNLQVYGSTTSGADYMVFSAANVGRLLLISRAINGKVWNLTSDNTGDFILGQTAGATNSFRIFGATNNIGINTGTDAGYKLDVNGTARVSGTLTGTGVTANAGTLQFMSTLGSIPGNYINFNNSGNITTTSGIVAHVISNTTFAPTSGSGVYNAISLITTINQTGGANGITRGLYVNPTLTAAADWRSIEWSNNTGWGLYGAGTAPSLLNGSLTAASIIKSGGTSSQILAADGSVITAGTNITISGGTISASGGGGSNIYTADGTLTGNRIVTMGSNTLTFEKDVIISTLTVGRGGGNITTNTAIGFSALLSNTTGFENVAIGYNSLYSCTTGFLNTAIGYEAIYNVTTGERNVAIGRRAGYGANLSNAVIIGQEAGITTTGFTTIAIGFRAGQNITGGSNIVIGANTGNSGISGINNILINGGGITSGSDNVVIGKSSGTTITSGGENVVVGNAAFNGTGAGNVAIGYLSLHRSGTYNYNTSIGYRSLGEITNGSNNTALGFYAGYKTSIGGNNDTSSNSIFIGYDVKPLNNTGTNQIIIGYQTSGLGSNTTIIGNSSTITSAIYGNLLLGTTIDAGFKLDVNGTARVSDTFTVGTNTFTNKLNAQFGTFGIQSFAINNGFMSDNMYYNSSASSWTRITTGFGMGFQFVGGQVVFHGVASGTGNFTQNVKFKFDHEGAFAIGNNLTGTLADYTGATALFTKNGRLLLGTTTEGTDIFLVAGTARINTAGGTTSQLLYLKNSTQNSTTASTQLVMFRDGASGIAYGGIVRFNQKAYTSPSSASFTQLDISMSDGATEVADTTPLSIRGTGIGINNTSPDASAMLDVASTTKGFLPPRVTTTEKNAIGSPAAGLVVYDTTTNKLCCYNGTSWNDLF